MIAKSWKDINWVEANESLATHQYRILKAYRESSLKEVLLAQHELVRSFSARCLAVRRVTSNSGKETPGIDGIILKTPQEKFEAVKAVKNLKGYKADPVLRVYVPKPNGKLRPLGIPTIKDRIVQTLFYFALDPIAEETSDVRSYGFRKYRGVNDNMIYLKLVLGNVTATRRFVLDADIQGFFDNVGHEWLLKNIPMESKVLKEFLKGGFMENSVFNETECGFPQGSPISPTLGNMALNGLQKHIGKEFLFTRYADDFLVIGKTVEDLKEIVLPRVLAFLKPRGLELNMAKTSVVEIDQGFDFLGFNLREYPDVSRAKGRKKGIFLIKPSSENISGFKKELTKIVREHRKMPMHLLIRKLNMKLRGWAEHFNSVTSKRVFTSISNHLWKIIWVMLKKRHRQKPIYWIVKSYFTKKENNKWIFTSRYREDGEQKEITLFQIAYVEIKRHAICLEHNPYDPEYYEYFRKRQVAGAKKSIILGRLRSKLLEKQKGICPVCKMFINRWEEVEVHHVKSRKLGGIDKPSNLRLLHKECHKQITHSRNEKLTATWKEEGIIL